MDIKQYNFGAISGNNVSYYSNHSIKGDIVKIIFQGGDARAAGSLFLYESGATPEQIFLLKTTLQTDGVYYPMVYPVDNTNAAISGAGGIVVRRTVNAPLRVVGSGLGNAGSTISGLTVYYY